MISGSGDGSYASGAKVTIKANTASSGQEFDRWLVNSGDISLTNANASSTTLTIRASAATVMATYRNVIVETIIYQAEDYAVYKSSKSVRS